ncbi:MAG: b(o/a)3-type cytochrome-c oxidase subunit 1 [Roseiflexaceae bacterium]
MQAVHPAPKQLRPLTFPRLAMLESERALVGAHILVALLSLSIGILLGPFQTFRRAPALRWEIPVFSYYYQALTIHGVINALFFTTFFIVGFSYFVTQRSLERPLWSRQLAWAAFVLMFVGLALVLFATGTNKANVLYTFYPSLIAHPTFYIGLVLLVVGSWLVAANIFVTYFGWRRDHPGERVPLAVFATMANYVMWCVATIGVAIEVLFMLLPLSLGWISTTDPQMARALFWFFGHPLVYFWLIPAYISWYTMLPSQTGSKLFSDPLARVAFLLLMVFSVPVGAHHLFSDPGVSSVMKGIHTVFTFVVAVPSFLTAFNIGAVLERAGRNRGARGPFGWLVRQDWGNPVVAAQLAGMILFVAGGFSGLIHASLTLNIALHNTSWVPAHFHMTLAGAVTLTYIGIVYWMLPLIRGRALWSRKVALAQIYTWLAGMLVFGHGMGSAGIAGAPRRTDLGSSPYLNETAGFFLNTAAIGGALLLVSSILLFVNIIGTLAFSRQPVVEDAPIQTSGPAGSPLWLERWGLWLGLMIILVLLAWGPLVSDALSLSGGFNTPGFRPESPLPLK